MTYNQMIEQLLTLFHAGKCGDFTLTDPDCMQVRYDWVESDGRVSGYSFMQLIEFPPDEGLTSFERQYLKVDAFDADDLWEHGQAFYSTREEFEALPEAVKFECVFEDVVDSEVMPCDRAVEAYKCFLLGLD